MRTTYYHEKESSNNMIKKHLSQPGGESYTLFYKAGLFSIHRILCQNAFGIILQSSQFFAILRKNCYIAPKILTEDTSKSNLPFKKNGC